VSSGKIYVEAECSLALLEDCFSVTGIDRNCKINKSIDRERRAARAFGKF
jgi:hypothetical protein